MNNLPNFPGASAVYTRALKITASLNAVEYVRQKHAAHKRGCKTFRFTPNSDAVAIIAAMNKGDEEFLKAMNHQFMHVWC
jgi:hypothetical protein